MNKKTWKNKKFTEPIMFHFILGINKHLNMLMISEAVSKDLKLNISSRRLWNYVTTKWDMSAIV